MSDLSGFGSHEDFQPILVRALGRRTRLDMSLHPGLPLGQADPAQFQSAILNLIINARDAVRQEGQVRIITGITALGEHALAENPDAKPGHFLSVAVEDNGSGMSDDVIAKAFEPFFTTKDPGQGTGLGLSQVYGFTRQSGGWVNLRSSPGTGTSVTLYLPVADNEAETIPVPATLGGEVLYAPAKGTNGLLVENDPDVLKAITACLSETGCHVQTAQEALGILQSQGTIGFLLTNVALQGGVSGIELGCIARKLQPTLPIILMTGRTATTLGGLGLAEDEFQLLRKPFQMDELLRQIGQAVAWSDRHPSRR